MKHLNLRNNEKSIAAAYFGLNLNGQEIAYAYIRKNACSNLNPCFVCR